MPEPKDADGKLTNADALESHPEFSDEYLAMSAEFFKKNNPGLHALMERLKNADQKPA